MIAVGFALRAGFRVLKNRMDLNYNNRQIAIYQRACTIIFEKAEETDTPREDTMILLNSAAEVYNESLRGKYAEALATPPFHIAQSHEISERSEGRQTDSQEEEITKK